MINCRIFCREIGGVVVRIGFVGLLRFGTWWFVGLRAIAAMGRSYGE